MRCTKLVLSVAAVMVAMLVGFSAPAMAADNNRHDNDRNDNHFIVFGNDNNDNFCDFFNCNFNRFDGFDNGFGDFEQEADSGDINQTFDVSGTGDNSNQTAGLTGNANTGNVQNQIGVTDFGNFGTFNDFDRFDGNPFFFDGFNGNGGDFEFDNTGADLTVTGNSTTSSDQEVNQSAAAG